MSAVVWHVVAATTDEAVDIVQNDDGERAAAYVVRAHPSAIHNRLDGKAQGMGSE